MLSALQEMKKKKDFFFTKTVTDNLLNISSVHPVREDIIDELLRKRNANKEIIAELIR